MDLRGKLAQETVQWRALLNTMVKFCIPYKYNISRHAEQLSSALFGQLCQYI
jgi:hypothetical protein